MGDKGLLITGPSGSGKSTLALEMLALGADLVTDDRCILERRGSQLWARAPANISGLIEARGVGILNARNRDDVAISALIDLAELQDNRLPSEDTQNLLGVDIPAYKRPANAPLAAIMMQLLKYGRHA